MSLFTSALRSLITAGGVFAGAINANQPSTSNPASPDSATVGTSGSSSVRFALETASGRSEPFLMWAVMIATFSNIIGTRPASTSGSSAPVPL